MTTSYVLSFLHMNKYVKFLSNDGRFPAVSIDYNPGLKCEFRCKYRVFYSRIMSISMDIQGKKKEYLHKIHSIIFKFSILYHLSK